MGAEDFRTLSELFLKAVDKDSARQAFLTKTAERYRGMTAEEALRRAAALAAALKRLGVRRGDRVAILSENRVEWALTDYAALGLGAAIVPIYPTLLESDIEFILRDSEPKGVVASTEVQLRKILNVQPKLSRPVFALAMNPARLEAGNIHDWGAVVEAELKSTADPIGPFRAQALAVQPGEIASILYTSGTTGRPKGVVLTHANIVSNIRTCKNFFPFAPDDVAMSFLPLSHVFERMLDYNSFWQGVCIGYAESIEALPQNLLEVRPTIMAVVPRVLEKVHEKVMETVRQAPQSRQKLFRWALEIGRRYFPCRLECRAPALSLRIMNALADALVFSKVRARLGGRVKILISGAAPLSRDLAEFFFAAGLPVYEGYGLTETSPVIAVNYPGSVKLGTVGRVIPDVEIRLDGEMVDVDGNAGREILVRGPNVTPGYYHSEEETRFAFADGWFRTGDLGILDSDGFLSITGRKKNLMKTSGGKYVSPEKLENLFQGHPYVSQVVVLGDARKFVGALIVPNFARLEVFAREHGIEFRNRQELVTNPRIQAFMQQQVDDLARGLPPHERIRRIALLARECSIQNGELSATQKIKRRVVEEHYRGVIEEIYQRPAPKNTAVEA